LAPIWKKLSSDANDDNKVAACKPIANAHGIYLEIAVVDCHIESSHHHREEADAGLDSLLYLRNKCSDKTLKSQKLPI